MKVEEVKKYAGQKKLLVLSNGFKYTLVIPKFSGSSFTAVDKYGNTVTIECEMIYLISDLGDDNE